MQMLGLLQECFLLKWLTKSSIYHCQSVSIRMNFTISPQVSLHSLVQLTCLDLYHVSTRTAI